MISLIDLSLPQPLLIALIVEAAIIVLFALLDTIAWIALRAKKNAPERAKRKAEKQAEKAKRQQEEDSLKAEKAKEAEEAKNQKEAEKAQKAEEAEKAKEAEQADKEKQAQDAQKAKEAEQAEKAKQAEEARQAEEAKRAQEAPDAQKVEEAKQAEQAAEAKQAQEAEQAKQVGSLPTMAEMTSATTNSMANTTETKPNEGVVSSSSENNASSANRADASSTGENTASNAGESGAENDKGGSAVIGGVVASSVKENREGEQTSSTSDAGETNANAGTSSETNEGSSATIISVKAASSSPESSSNVQDNSAERKEEEPISAVGAPDASKAGASTTVIVASEKGFSLEDGAIQASASGSSTSSDLSTGASAETISSQSAGIVGATASSSSNAEAESIQGVTNNEGGNKMAGAFAVEMSDGSVASLHELFGVSDEESVNVMDASFGPDGSHGNGGFLAFAFFGALGKDDYYDYYIDPEGSRRRCLYHRFGDGTSCIVFDEELVPGEFFPADYFEYVVEENGERNRIHYLNGVAGTKEDANFADPFAGSYDIASYGEDGKRHLAHYEGSDLTCEGIVDDPDIALHRDYTYIDASHLSHARHNRLAKQPVEKAIVATAPKKEEENIMADETMNKASIKRTPFSEKLAKADEVMSARYETIKAEMLAYGIHSRVSIPCDTYSLHRKDYLKITIDGKTLKVFFRLKPHDYDDTTIPHEDASDKKTYIDTPMLLHITSDLAMRRAVALVDEMMAKEGFVKKTKK